jgi:hypothetical protein
MKRLSSLFVMLALVVVMTVPGTALDRSSQDVSLNAVGHTQMTGATMANMLADCCGVEDGKMHHVMSGCAIDCANAVPSVAVSFAQIDADLRTTDFGRVLLGIAFTQFRPPIAA